MRRDRAAITALVNVRVPANEGLEKDEAAQCGTLPFSGRATIGMLGILNALFGTNEKGTGHLGAVFGENGEVHYFCLMTEPVLGGVMQLPAAESGEDGDDA